MNPLSLRKAHRTLQRPCRRAIASAESGRAAGVCPRHWASYLDCTAAQHRCYVRFTTLPPESAGTASGRGRLMDRRIVVAGARSGPSPDARVTVGNGPSIAVLCAQEGAAVACTNRDVGAANTTAELCRREGAGAVTIGADLRDADSRARLVSEAHDKLDGLDGVVANVGHGNGQGLSDTSARQCHYSMTTALWFSSVQPRACGQGPVCPPTTLRRPPCFGRRIPVNVATGLVAH